MIPTDLYTGILQPSCPGLWPATFSSVVAASGGVISVGCRKHSVSGCSLPIMQAGLAQPNFNFDPDVTIYNFHLAKDFNLCYVIFNVFAEAFKHFNM